MTLSTALLHFHLAVSGAYCLVSTDTNRVDSLVMIRRLLSQPENFCTIWEGRHVRSSMSSICRAVRCVACGPKQLSAKALLCACIYVAFPAPKVAQSKQPEAFLKCFTTLGPCVLLHAQVCENTNRVCTFPMYLSRLLTVYAAHKGLPAYKRTVVFRSERCMRRTEGRWQLFPG